MSVVFQFGDAGINILQGTDGNEDTLAGNGGNDYLFGFGASDFLIGGSGDDVMVGGAGNDGYSVDSSNDVVREETDEGVDTVYAMGVSYTLAANVENLVMTGAYLQGIGNDLNNILTASGSGSDLYGLGGDDVLIGGAGKDSFFGGDGIDTLSFTDEHGPSGMAAILPLQYLFDTFGVHDFVIGIERILGSDKADYVLGTEANEEFYGFGGNDYLNGGEGADLLVGGDGSDVYNVNSRADVVVENLQDTGIDRVVSTSTFNAAANGGGVEIIALDGNAAANIKGNALDNTLTGNDANNMLNGGSGADWLEGGLGKDTYVIDNAGDIVVEDADEGRDFVRSSIDYQLTDNVEVLTLMGVRNIKGTGNDLDNVIIGNAGDNVLKGGAGRDTLTGGGGSDTFVIDNAKDSGFYGYDRITDLGDDDWIDFTDIKFGPDTDFAIVDGFDGHAGQMMFNYNAAKDFTVLAVDVDGDSVADIRVVINGDHRAFTNFIDISH